MGKVVALPNADPHFFWDGLSPSEHVVQIYGTDRVFLDGLTGFVASALESGEAAIVVATAMHLHGLEQRMRGSGIDVDRALAAQRYVPRLAEDLLARVMERDWPNERSVVAAMNELLARARGEDGRDVRVFSEMVAILWARGNHAAAIHLELLWSGLCRAERFPLFCAYPRDTFSRNATESIVEICRIHSKVAPAVA